MSLQKKIIISFLISSTIIAILAFFAYISYLEIRTETRYLELSDTIRSKSLLLRRHEKNFFLYREKKEAEYVHNYIIELKSILNISRDFDNSGRLKILIQKVNAYRETFNQINNITDEFQKKFDLIKPSYPHYYGFFYLIESTILERPLINSELLRKVFQLKQNDPIINNLRQLNIKINSLRKCGEEILTITNELDKSARERVEKAISISQNAVLILFPMFMLVGLTLLFYISQNVVNRLRILTHAIEQTGKGKFLSLKIPSKQDEVGILIDSFNKMELDLIERDREISRKNEELLQSRKLASIGTLASGVAHELNNPLNNIYLSAQILSQEIEGQTTLPPIIREVVGDIYTQTLRVKRIVSDLLEFSRDKSPELTSFKIADIINSVLDQICSTGNMIDVYVKTDFPPDTLIKADRHLLEQVFVNIFNNAIEAMDGKGTLTISVSILNNDMEIRISDTGKGIPLENKQKIFDPFFTTKEKGTGLGMAIVYNIIKKHNGKIDFTSEIGKGTTFIITLPVNI